MKILSICGSPRKGKQQESTSAQVLLKIAELGEMHKVSGPKDSSERIDELLWKKNWEKS